MTLLPEIAHSGERTTVSYARLHAFTARLFAEHGIPDHRAHLAAEALCHGDLCGFDSHGLFNLTRLYLPLLRSGRVDPTAEPTTRIDLGACAVLDAHRALGLWTAAEAVDAAAHRALEHGVGLVPVRGGTHFGCAGFHAARAAERGLVGIVASNCGSQRIARPPLGALAMLGTNPISVAAPALDGHPFVLDMSTTTVPTGKVRVAASDGERVPPGWLADDTGNPVTDPAAFDRGEAHLRWLGGEPATGAHKGFGLGLVVEVLSALLSGAGVGPAPAALDGDGGPHGRDDDIGYFVLVLAPDLLRPGGAFAADARSLFGTLLDCPAAAGEPVRYPGWHEAERAARRRRDGVPLRASVHRELVELGLDESDVDGGAR
ncbi:Ldh family oxidoreductase [Saccharopolyspora sp. 6V]|uniref:Ldh family oxidoreductase n=1 Tax=Saccharopolyspora sp. 6V TaxID=2877239 RepID=UPI001CD2772A|nr:Ldh family oxidoreductase [Saccharopolyspora sp. 6V]MCA1191925.1 Ldh family oxidoreductase [Saccharopolyspora sp. 6V]